MFSCSILERKLLVYANAEVRLPHPLLDDRVEMMVVIKTFDPLISAPLVGR